MCLRITSRKREKGGGFGSLVACAAEGSRGIQSRGKGHGRRAPVAAGWALDRMRRGGADTAVSVERYSP